MNQPIHNIHLSAAEQQVKLLQGLLQARAYPHQVDKIERIETHISTVLLAGDFAYKIKKPVSLGFLDFSTLPLRCHYCEEELRLNRRLAPRLYLEAVSIVGSVEAPRIGSLKASNAIEYAVRMRRFAQTALLDRMLEAGQLTPQHLDALAAVVAAFHARIERSVDHLAGRANGDAGAHAVNGLPASIAAPMLQNFEQIRPLLVNDEERAALARLEEWSRAAHIELATLMEQRRRAGCVRECHGDLHLGNITWIDDEIQVFDCIEFNPALRWIDVASEIAFTVMDLAARGKPAWGARYLNDYLEITGDYAALRLIKYYLVYRAMVRAKVARIRAAQTGEAQREAGLLIASGYPVIADATFLQRAWRDDFRKLAAELQVPFLILECRADADALRRRVAQRERQGQDASEAARAVLERQLQEDEALAAGEAECAVIVETQHDTAEEIVERVRRRLAAWPI